MVTIGILFCDNDVKYLFPLLKKIKSRITIDHELIFFDNRNDTSSDISCIDGYKVLNTGNGNMYQVEGRKQIVYAAQGDYVWFIDCDDEPLIIDHKITELLDKEYDAYCFGWASDTEHDVNTNLYKKDELLTGDIVKQYSHIAMPALWNKLIKTEVLLKAEELIPEGIKASAGEDLMLVALALKFCSTLYICTQEIYKNNSKHGSSPITDYSLCYDKFERCAFGHADTMSIIINNIPDNKDIVLGDVNYFLMKLSKTKDEAVLNKMLNYMNTYFAKPYIDKMVEYISLYSWMFEDSERIEKVRRVLCGKQ